MSTREIDELSGTETTGHEWDGIKELNTPLPRWWLWTFYACIVFAIGYAIAYPAIPLISSATPGLLGYSSRAQLADSVETADMARADLVAEIAEASPADIVANEELARFARAAGRSAFLVNCSQCHGTGAQGAPGYPNLNDDEWIWGGTPDQIYTTIAHGVRFDGDDNTHRSAMPAFGREAMLERDDIRAVATYVVALSGNPDVVASDRGKEVYSTSCIACHGADGQGTTPLGAPALANGIWLYGGEIDDVVAQVTDPRHGVMPAWAGRLSDTTIKQLAVYVHGLGGGR
jgi:cytochrome c oxidase cbb3-type subunit III